MCPGNLFEQRSKEVMEPGRMKQEEKLLQKYIIVLVTAVGWLELNFAGIFWGTI